MKGPAESGQICSVGRRKIAKKIALLCQHLATPLKDAVEGDEGGLGGHYPLGHLRREGGSISALRVTGLPKVILEGRPPTPPPTPLIYWGDLSVTGNGDLPLATQRRVERASLLIDRPSPALDRIYQLGLWSAIFFAIFLRLPPNKFLRIPPDFSPVSIRLALLFLLLFAQGMLLSATDGAGVRGR